MSCMERQLDLNFKDSQCSLISNEIQKPSQPYTGLLYVQSRITKSWKERYFVLRQRELSLYFDEKSYCNNTDAARRIHIMTALRWYQVNLGLFLVSESGERIKTCLHHSSVGLYKEIADALEVTNSTISEKEHDLKQLDYALSERHSIESLNPLYINNRCSNGLLDQDYTGWFLKKGKIVKNWKRRYFVLSGRTLAYFDINLEGEKAKGVGVVERVERDEPNILIFYMRKRFLVTRFYTEIERNKWFEMTNSRILS